MSAGRTLTLWEQTEVIVGLRAQVRCHDQTIARLGAMLREEIEARRLKVTELDVALEANDAALRDAAVAALHFSRAGSESRAAEKEPRTTAEAGAGENSLVGGEVAAGTNNQSPAGRGDDLGVPPLAPDSISAAVDRAA